MTKWRKLKKKLVNLSLSFFSPESNARRRFDWNEAYRAVELPFTLKAAKLTIIKRTLTLMVSVLLTIWGVLSTTGVLRSLILLGGTCLFLRYASYLNALFRLRDFVTLTSDTLVVHSIFTQKNIPWHSISEVSLSYKLFDGLGYVIKLKDGSSVTITDKITKHYLIYHYITQRISARISD